MHRFVVDRLCDGVFCVVASRCQISRQYPALSAETVYAYYPGVVGGYGGVIDQDGILGKGKSLVIHRRTGIAGDCADSRGGCQGQWQRTLADAGGCEDSGFRNC